jgi:hypothetical protein
MKKTVLLRTSLVDFITNEDINEYNVEFYFALSMFSKQQILQFEL